MLTKILASTALSLAIRHGEFLSLEEKEARLAPKPAHKAPMVMERIAPSTDGGPIVKPGCTAADESGLAHYHLVGLSRGLGGFGVLRETKRRLERAAEGATIAQDMELAGKFRRIADQLPDVHDEATAGRLASELEPLLPVAWELGKRCGGGKLSPELMEKVKDLSAQLQAGKLTKEQAVAQLRGSLAGKAA